ncbi:hypothetical protein AAKU55_001441 [Oxalobacteraceae bacterium GrIS 1.11]
MTTPLRRKTPVEYFITVVKNVKNTCLVFFIVVGGFLTASVLCWPILLGFQKLSDAVYVPHAFRGYHGMNSLSGMGVLDFPHDYNAFAMFLMNAPLGFFVIFWYLFIFIVLSDAYGAWKKLPKRDKILRSQKINKIIWRGLKGVLVTSGIFFALSLPFIRTYEIYSDDEIRIRNFYDWGDTVYSFSRLEKFKRSVTGKGLISWDFYFNNGQSLTMFSPSAGIIDKILSLPNVESNVYVINNELRQKK